MTNKQVKVDIEQKIFSALTCSGCGKEREDIFKLEGISLDFHLSSNFVDYKTRIVTISKYGLESGLVIEGLIDSQDNYGIDYTGYFTIHCPPDIKPYHWYDYFTLNLKYVTTKYNTGVIVSYVNGVIEKWIKSRLSSVVCMSVDTEDNDTDIDNEEDLF